MEEELGIEVQVEIVTATSSSAEDERSKINSVDSKRAQSPALTRARLRAPMLRESAMRGPPTRREVDKSFDEVAYSRVAGNCGALIIMSHKEIRVKAVQPGKVGASSAGSPSVRQK